MAVLPLKADPVLVIDSYAILAGAISAQAFKAIARSDPELGEVPHAIQLI
jgi:hypothetical protein